MSAQIQKLPQHVIAQIAAGEVVERPASIVKELVDNALDAGATQVDIAFAGGGIDFLQIKDNGHGIARNQLALALEAHATSKLHDSDDLHTLQSRGFRGEALSSICAVSHLNLKSMHVDNPDNQAFEINVNDKGVDQAKPCSLQMGTQLSIKHLFYNTPARKQFLKHPRTEKSHLIACYKKLALANPNVGFSLTEHVDDKVRELYRWSACDNLIDRIAHVYPGDSKDKLLAVDYETPHLRIAGYVSDRTLSFNRSSDIHFFVNNKPVFDKTMQAALTEGYRSAMLEKRYPMAVLHLNLDPMSVDINIHPRKSEVRFSAPQYIFEHLSQSIKQTLNAQRPTNTMGHTHMAKQKVSSQDYKAWTEKMASNNHSSLNSSHGSKPHTHNSVSQAASPSANSQYKETGKAFAFEKQSQAPYMTQDFFKESALDYQADASDAASVRFSDLTYLDHVDHTFLICSNKLSLYIIDQHAAHERVLYQKLQQKGWHNDSQLLLSPIDIVLDQHELDLLQNSKHILEKMGFALEFTTSSLKLTAAPSGMHKHDPKQIVLDFCNDLKSDAHSFDLTDQVDAVYASMACHSAVRAHDVLTAQEVKALLQSMDETELAAHCPHGRPTFRQWSIKDFEKMFKRIV